LTLHFCIRRHIN